MKILGYRHLERTGPNNKVRNALDLLSVIDFEEFVKIIDAFDSVDDYPIPNLYRRLHDRFPDAKFVLTRRASTEAWVDSVISEYNRKSWNEGEYFWFAGTFSHPDRRRILGSIYNRHLTSVRDYFGRSRDFLEVCWEEGHGWNELCDFLGTARPDAVFPHAHRRAAQVPSEILLRMLDERRYHKAYQFVRELKDPGLEKILREWSLQFVLDNGLAPTAGDMRLRPTRPNVPKSMHALNGRNAKKHTLAVCSIFRDEAKFIGEWLDFHACMGVTHFFLYNDNSSDDYLQVLEPWIKRGRVTLTDWPVGTQVEAFNHCLHKTRELVQWMAFIDIDEFLFSPRSLSLPQVLSDYEEHPAIFVFWALFGSGGNVDPPEPSVINSYRMHQSRANAQRDNFDHGIRGTGSHITAWSRDGKSLVQTDAVLKMNNHIPSRLRWGHTVDEHGVAIPITPEERRLSGMPFSYDRLRINHYWSKSIKDLTRRSQRGDVFDRSRPPRQLDRLLLRESQLNDVYDETIISVWRALRNSGLAST